MRCLHRSTSFRIQIIVVHCCACNKFLGAIGSGVNHYAYDSLSNNKKFSYFTLLGRTLIKCPLCATEQVGSIFKVINDFSNLARNVQWYIKEKVNLHKVVSLQHEIFFNLQAFCESIPTQGSMLLPWSYSSPISYWIWQDKKSTKWFHVCSQKGLHSFAEVSIRKKCMVMVHWNECS